MNNKLDDILKFLLVLLLLVTVLSCSSNTSTVAGATTETTNGTVTTTVINPGGYPEKNATVILRAKESSEISYTTTTDEHGVFRFDSIPEGEYSIEVIGTSGLRALFDWSNDYDNELPVQEYLVLSDPGRIFGVVTPASDSTLIEIKGLEIAVIADSTGYFILDSLPEGRQVVTISTSSKTTVDTVVVMSGEATNMGTVDTRSDYTKDSTIVAQILAENSIDLKVTAVTKVRDGRIREIKIDSEKMTVLSSDIRYLRLETLSLAGNKLTSVPDELTEVTTLTDLDLSKNDIAELPASIGRLTACTYLDLGQNQLTDLPESVLNLSSMKQLFVNGNHLVNLPTNIYEWVDENSMDNTWYKSQTSL